MRASQLIEMCRCHNRFSSASVFCEGWVHGNNDTLHFCRLQIIFYGFSACLLAVKIFNCNPCSCYVTFWTMVTCNIISYMSLKKRQLQPRNTPGRSFFSWRDPGCCLRNQKLSCCNYSIWFTIVYSKFPHVRIFPHQH